MSWNFGTLAAGSSSSFELVVRVLEPASDEGRLDFAASLQADDALAADAGTSVLVVTDVPEPADASCVRP